jgi:hypothetical protein
MTKELVETTISNELHPMVKKRLTEIAQLLQTYCRLAELELAAGEWRRADDVALPEDTGKRIRGWAEGEETKEREREELEEEISRAMSARGHDPTPIREARGG